MVQERFDQEREVFINKYRPELNEVQSQGQRILEIMEEGAKNLESKSKYVLALKAEFQFGLGLDEESVLRGLVNVMRIMRLVTTDELPEADEDKIEFDKNTYQTGLEVRKVMMEAIGEDSRLKNSSADFDFFVRIALREILASEMNQNQTTS